MSSSIYNISAKDIKGNEISLNDYKGKNILIVNTASKCGFTPQYDGLQKLYLENKDNDFVILGFPCDQFGNQEPGNDDSISEFCKLNFGVTFPLFSKIDVNGKNQHPLFKLLTKKLPGVFGRKIKWNFTKFLINSEGIPVKRFSPTYAPEKIEKYLQKLRK